MAGGFSIDKKNIPLFRDFIIKEFEKKNKLTSEINLYLDSTIAPTAVNENFYQEINSLAPFGSGNSEPKFVIENLRVLNSKVVGDEHVKSILSGKDGTILKTFARNAKNTPLGTVLTNNKQIFNIAGKMRLNEWQGKRDVEFIIEDIALS